MVLKTHRWGGSAAESVVCLHGVTQHGRVFEDLGRHLSAHGRSVVAVDLRGHGESGREPPWNTETHARDVLETLDAVGVEGATWVGHSFGGRVAALLAAESAERSRGLVLLDASLEVPPQRALRSAEIERLDWSFATVDGAVNALLSNEHFVAAPRDVVTAFVRDDLRKGTDGRFRFSFSPGAAVVAWSEVALPAPPIARVRTLLIRAEAPLHDAGALLNRYEEELGDLFTAVTVPNGHNVLWEAPRETIAAIERFLDPAAVPSAGE